MVHRSMRNDSRVADELYIKRVLLVLEDFLFFSLYSFSCIAKQVTTLKQLQPCLVLISSKPISVFLSCYDITFLLPISPTHDPACYTRTSPTTSYLILDVPTSLHGVQVLFRTLLCFQLGLPSTESSLNTRLR
jgi:hypothetical protein